HDEARSDEGRERHAENLAPAPSHGYTEDDEEQQGSDGWRPDSLRLHLEKPPDLLHIEAPQPNPVESGDERLSFGRKSLPDTDVGVDEFGLLAGADRRGGGLIGHAGRLSALPRAGNTLCGCVRRLTMEFE